MKKILLIIMLMLAFGGLVQAQEDKSFDFNKYKDAVDREAFYLCFWDGALKYADYALIDIDGDGKSELWVRSEEEQSWQGVFAIDGDSVVFLAYADRCCDMAFFKDAVGYSSYVSPGNVDVGYCVLKDSRIVASAFKHVEFNVFSDEMEIEDESYIVNDEETEEESYNRFVQQLGETIEIEPVWHKIK
jgi:hypothetical protein